MSGVKTTTMTRPTTNTAVIDTAGRVSHGLVASIAAKTTQGR